MNEPKLEVCLFGSPRLTFGGADWPFAVALPTISLFAYILLHCARPTNRALAAFALWPDMSEAAALARLRRFLFALNVALPQHPPTPWIIADKKTIQWNARATTWVDTVEFERLSAKAVAPARAVSLYAGDLLPEIEDEWIVEPRARLRLVQIANLQSLIAANRLAGIPSRALIYAQQLLAIEPWREDIVRAAIELRSQSGDRAGALKQYSLFSARLETELGVGPMAETVTLHDRIVAGPVMTAALISDNVPSPPTSFIGRNSDLEWLCALLTANDHRLVTLTGAGGIGKSRLAVETARALVSGFADGVWLVELGAVTDPEFVCRAIADVVGVSQSGERPFKDALTRALRVRRLVIILDNCEHLLDGVADIVATLIAAGPDVHVLATSREPLRVAGETIYALSTLAYPSDVVRSPAEALEYAAVQLFVQRASMLAQRTFEVTDENVVPVVDIVRRLDGLPLAIELATSKLRILSVWELAARLQDRFELLVGGNRDALPRHQTLRALIDWSYESLTEVERLVFENCSAFAGHFSSRAVIALCTREGDDETGILRSIAALVDKSLLNVSGTNELRYSMLESMREYARERTEVSGTRDALRRRHALYYLRVAQQNMLSVDKRTRSTRVKELQPDNTNFEAALRWSLIERRDGELGGNLVLALTDLFEHESYSRSRQWFERALDVVVPASSPALFAALVIKLELFSRFSPDAAKRIANIERAVAIYREIGDRRRLMRALGWLSNASATTGNSALARRASDEAVSLARDAADPKELAWALRVSALSLLQHDPAKQITLLQESLATYCPAVPDDDIAFCFALLGEAAFLLGDARTAREQTRQAIDILDQTPALFRPARASYLSNVAAYSMSMRDFAAARSAAHAALRISVEIGDAVQIAYIIGHFAFGSALLGESATAAQLLGFADSRTASVSNATMRIETECRARLSALLGTGLDSRERAALERAGASWSEEFAVAQARQTLASTADSNGIGPPPKTVFA